MLVVALPGCCCVYPIPPQVSNVDLTEKMIYVRVTALIANNFLEGVPSQAVNFRCSAVAAKPTLTYDEAQSDMDTIGIRFKIDVNDVHGAFVTGIKVYGADNAVHSGAVSTLPLLATLGNNPMQYYYIFPHGSVSANRQYKFSARVKTDTTAYGDWADVIIVRSCDPPTLTNTYPNWQVGEKSALPYTAGTTPYVLTVTWAHAVDVGGCPTTSYQIHARQAGTSGAFTALVTGIGSAVTSNDVTSTFLHAGVGECMSWEQNCHVGVQQTSSCLYDQHTNHHPIY